MGGLYLSYELHDEVHHQFGVLVEHSLPQFVHHTLREVEDVVDQNLVAASAAERQRGIFTWTETRSKTGSYEYYILYEPLMMIVLNFTMRMGFNHRLYRRNGRNIRDVTRHRRLWTAARKPIVSNLGSTILKISGAC